MAEKILFITGKLAERQLKRILRSMKPDFGFKINQITDVTPIAHNGCRPPKKRRV